MNYKGADMMAAKWRWLFSPSIHKWIKYPMWDPTYVRVFFDAPLWVNEQYLRFDKRNAQSIAQLMCTRRVASCERQTMSQLSDAALDCKDSESLAKFIETLLSKHFQEADDVAKERFSWLKVMPTGSQPFCCVAAFFPNSCLLWKLSCPRA